MGHLCGMSWSVLVRNPWGLWHGKDLISGPRRTAFLRYMWLFVFMWVYKSLFVQNLYHLEAQITFSSCYQDFLAVTEALIMSLKHSQILQGFWTSKDQTVPVHLEFSIFDLCSDSWKSVFSFDRVTFKQSWQLTKTANFKIILVKYVFIWPYFYYWK